MKILVFSGNQPVLDVSLLDVTEDSPNFGVKYGLNRDRNPDSGWGELRKTKLERAQEIEPTTVLKQILLEDLAYVYGQDSKKFIEKLKEFKLL